MRYRIFRKKTYIMQEQAPISAADSNALAARNCEGTEQLRFFISKHIKISHVLTAVVVTWLIYLLQLILLISIISLITNAYTSFTIILVKGYMIIYCLPGFPCHSGNTYIFIICLTFIHTYRTIS